MSYVQKQRLDLDLVVADSCAWDLMSVDGREMVTCLPIASFARLQRNCRE